MCNLLITFCLIYCPDRFVPTIIISVLAPQPVAAAAATVKVVTDNSLNHPQFQLVQDALIRKKHMSHYPNHYQNKNWETHSTVSKTYSLSQSSPSPPLMVQSLEEVLDLYNRRKQQQRRNRNHNNSIIEGKCIREENHEINKTSVNNKIIFRDLTVAFCW